jgi:hypothetical protein
MLACGLLCFATARAEDWKRWPANAGEHGTTIAAPPGFSALHWRPPVQSRPRKDAPLLLSGRFRSSDGSAEFSVMVYYVRALPNEAEVRRIKLKLEDGAKLIEQKSSRKKVNGEAGPYFIYDEESTVGGAGYTRYRLNTFSTSSLPGAASVLWEFQVADEAARKRFAPVWKKFKDTLEVEDD